MRGVRRTLTDVAGVRVGHATTPDGATGVTVVRFATAVPTVVDVRGGASATFDTASLGLEATFGRRWALFFAGGSLFGLDAAAGIRSRLLEDGDGHRAFRSPHRIVPISGAALFDLPRRPGPLPDYRALGYAATASASRAAVPCGRVGAGAGATVGKYLGRSRAMEGGVGSSAMHVRGAGRVGVLVAVNSVGAIRDPSSGRWLAGARRRDGAVRPPPHASSPSERGTSLVAVVTDAALTRAELARVAMLAQTGLARAVFPANTATDGDVVFATATSEATTAGAHAPGARADLVGSAAAELVVRSLALAVRPG